MLGDDLHGNERTSEKEDKPDRVEDSKDENDKDMESPLKLFMWDLIDKMSALIYKLLH